jgi:hypothetical protein
MDVDFFGNPAQWEKVSTQTDARGAGSVVHRISVPGGWIYSVAFSRKRWLRGLETHISTVFVPTPKE